MLRTFSKHLYSIAFISLTCICAFGQVQKYIHPSLIEIHFSSANYQTSSLSGSTHNLNGGIALAFTKGINSYLDWRIMVNAAYPDSFIKAGSRQNEKNLLLESDASLRARLFAADMRVHPYLQAGLGLFAYKNYFGAYLPAGPGIEVRLFNQVYMLANAQYRVMFTNNAGSHVFYSIGLAGSIGAKRTKTNSKAVPAISMPINTAARDRDNDGIVDTADLCPDEAGLSIFQGCPDSDNDGIPDKEDKCPKQFGFLRYQGCPVPDTDGDGVNDEEDSCMYVRGPKENKGCPTVSNALKEKVDSIARKIYFQTGKAALMPSSYKVLNTLADILKSDTTLKLIIEGHTDNIGKPADNQILSNDRARTVLEFLAANGISSRRLASIGYGQDRPVADNKTASGRAENRRVELKLFLSK